MVEFFKSRLISEVGSGGMRFRMQTELPWLTFNKMCYGYLLNDWSLVFSSIATFLFTIVHLLSSGHGKF
jgi:hypothetical protein